MAKTNCIAFIVVLGFLLQPMAGTLPSKAAPFFINYQLIGNDIFIDLKAVRYMGEMTSEKARQFLEHPLEKASGYEVGGYFFVNFLRTRYAGKGYPDAQVRLARAITDVGNGASFAQAFAGQFNCSLEQAQNEFCRYLDVTNGNPAQRFVGTELESIYRLAVQSNAQSSISDQENN